MTQKISITRALATVKRLEKSITSKINELRVITPERNGELYKELGKTKGSFASKAIADYQSLIALMENRRKLKSAIVESNAKTLVQIPVSDDTAIEMTVADAIERKNSMIFEKDLLQSLSQSVKAVTNEVEKANIAADSQLQQHLQSLLGRDAKVDGSNMDSITDAFNKKNKQSVYDPMNVNEIIKNLDDLVQNFTMNVDLVLSESNASTFIEIDLTDS